MRGTGVEVCLAVVVRTLVLVADEEAYGRAEGDAVLEAGLEMDEVLLIALLNDIWSNCG